MYQQPPPNPNYPYQQPPPPPGSEPHPAVQVVDKSAERALSALAHGAIGFSLFGVTFFVSLAVTGIIWLYSKRSPEVRFHAEQAGCYQVIVLAINFTVVLLLSASGGFAIFNLFRGQNIAELNTGVVVGLCLFGAWFVLSILYGLFAALMVLMGRRFKYPIIGDRFEKKVW
ncbi:MAG TPA: DUF4870 domain-containing protein [Chloroflexia bacterium]|nr:DUF4870 domain-containing protein [Chloroflexia bacterium]